MSIICAFDVGIKNLPFCILRCDKDKKIVIDGWELLDISESKIFCQGILKNGKICGKKAKFCVTQQDEKLGYCSAHKGQYLPPDFDEQVKKCKKKNDKCQYNGKKECVRNAISRFDHSNYCSTHLKSVKNLFTKEHGLKTIKRSNCNKESLMKLGQKMYDLLDKHPKILQSTHILIENQPSLKNPTMKTISILLYSYFIIRGLMDKDKTGSKIECVDFISPGGKLKINENLTKEVFKICKSKRDKYDTTKELGILYCKELLKSVEDSKKYQNILEKNKKQDDLCDAFLHAYYYYYGSTGLNNEQFCENTTNYFKEKLLKRTQKIKKIKEN